MADQAPILQPIVADSKSYDTNSKPVDADFKAYDSSSTVSEQSTLSNPFLNPKVAAHYRQVYDNADYECRHEFDPDLEWSPAEEKRIIRKLDWHVSLWACMMFFSLNIDRKNLGQAVSDNLLDDLGLSTNDYNTGNTIFLVSFLLAELPSQLISKRIGPDRWIPTQMVLWSIVAAAQAGLNGRGSFYACRVLLGILEGGFIPDLVLWLSYFYTSAELAIRLSYFWVALDLSVVALSFMAFGLLHLRGVAGIAGWRWLFLIEGLITLIIGFMSFFLMPASAVQTKTWFRPNGWFSDREVKIVVNRVLRDDPTKGDMHNRKGINLKGLWAAFSDYDLWPLYAIGLLVYIPQSPPSTYLTLSLRNLGFSTFETNLLAIPSEVISCFTLIGITWLSVRLNERSLVAWLQSWWVLPCLIALRAWPASQSNAWGTYGLITTLLSYPYCHAIVVSWVSQNSGSVRTRSVSAALYNITVQLGNIISANIYRADDAPLYQRGNTVLIVLAILSILLFVATKLYYIYRNKALDRRWNAMSLDEKDHYIETTTDEGNKRLDFRFAH